MPYTIAKFFIWALGFALIGVAVGWLLRSIRCGRELATARTSTVDLGEYERMRHRVASLEPIVADRDRLRDQVAVLEAERKSARAAAPEAAAAGMQGFAGVPPVVAEPLDLDSAKTVLGRSVALDDLKLVEGIGPALEGVLHAGGISTWSQLAATEPAALRSILVAADERHRMHDPSSWPRQAALAASGQWQALKDLQQQLTAGRD